MGEPRSSRFEWEGNAAPGPPQSPGGESGAADATPEPTEGSASDELEVIRGRALFAAKVASELKGLDIKLLGMSGLVSYADYLIISTGRSTRQTRRIAEEIELKLKRDLQVVPGRVEGKQWGEWILLDYVDFIVHVFTPEAREFYRLDVLWKEAPTEVVE